MALSKPALGAGTSRAELWLQALLHLKTFLSPFKQTNKQRQWQAPCLWGQGGWLLSYKQTLGWEFV